MELRTFNLGQPALILKHFAQRLLILGENRLELLMMEVQEERMRLLHAMLLVLGVAAFGLLAGVALTAAIVVLLWDVSPVATLLALTSLNGAVAVFLYGRLAELRRGWKTLPATLDQFRKDCACCLEKALE